MASLNDEQIDEAKFEEISAFTEALTPAELLAAMKVARNVRDYKLEQMAAADPDNAEAAAHMHGSQL